MKVTMTIEDTPKGVRAEVVWNGNDVTDHVETSLAMKIVANFANDLKAMDELGVVVVEKIGENHG